MGSPADAFLEDAGSRGVSSNLAGLGNNSQVKCRVTGTAVGTHTYDQAAFFSLLGDVVIAATTYVLATVTPAVSRFTAAQVSSYIGYNPLPLRNINIVGANSADAVASIEVQPIRVTPMGQSAAESLYASSFQTSGDYQDTRVQVPIELVVDGYSYFRIISDAKATAVTYSVAFTFGARLDRRLEVPQASPVVVRSSAQR